MGAPAGGGFVSEAGAEESSPPLPAASQASPASAGGTAGAWASGSRPQHACSARGSAVAARRGPGRPAWLRARACARAVLRGRWIARGESSEASGSRREGGEGRGNRREGKVGVLPWQLVAVRGYGWPKSVLTRSVKKLQARLLRQSCVFPRTLSGLISVNTSTLEDSCMFIWSGFSRHTVSVCKYVYKCTYWV